MHRVGLVTFKINKVMQKIKLFIALGLFISAGVFSCTHNARNSIACGYGTYKTDTYCIVVDLDDNCTRVGGTYTLSNCDAWDYYPDEDDCVIGGCEDEERIYELWDRTCSNEFYMKTCLGTDTCDYGYVQVMGTEDLCSGGDDLYDCQEETDCDAERPDVICVENADCL